MVYFMENPNLKWMIWGYSHDSGNLHNGAYHIPHEQEG